MKFYNYLFQDWSANSGNPKGRLVMFLFRSVSCLRLVSKPYLYLFYPYLILYRFFVEWIMGVELPWKLRVGPGLRIYHGQGLVVNDRVIIGANCTLRHCTTIGVAETSLLFDGGVPVIGDNVDVGSNAVIVGAVHIGDFSKIGAGSVVVKNVPSFSVAVGNPARILHK